MTIFSWLKEAENQWDQRAASWNERSTSMWDKGSRKDIIPFIEKYSKKGKSILDIGCGDGYGSYKLYQSGYNVVGVDLSSEMIAHARERIGNEAINFKQEDITQLTFDNNQFDGMMAINVLEWTEIPVKALREMARVLKNDGLLFIGILGPTAGPRANSFRRNYGEHTICNTMMPWEFHQLAQENSFEYIDGMGVYKQGIKEEHYRELPLELKQALTFMWVSVFRKVGEENG